MIEIWILAATFKLLVWSTYRSTDFSVHAHWLSLTSSFPSKFWYFDTSSRWTLDYPPLFAWFEYSLSLLMAPSEMIERKGEEESLSCWKGLNIGELNNCFSSQSVLWHRLTVVLSELLFLSIGVRWFVKTWPEATKSELALTKEKAVLVTVLIAFDPNLFILDHIHFQYNGYLLGILIMSIASLRSNQDILGAFLFAILLCSKHIFVMAAPLYFIYLLAHYCLSSNIKNFMLRTGTLGIVVIVVFSISFFSVCPTFEIEKVTISLKQIGSRLFPVSERGLLHAYWAPNFWAMYAGLDKFLKVFLLSLGYELSSSNSTISVSSTQGLVQGEIDFDVLPQVPKIATIVFSFLGMIPALYKVWRCRRPQVIIHAYCCCVMSSIFFGYHVHEKALSMVSVPLSLCALDSAFDARTYLMLTWITQVCLSPLLFPQELSSFKVLFLLTHGVGTYTLINNFHLQQRRERRIQFGHMFRSSDIMYLCGLFATFCFYEYGALLERILFNQRYLERYPFLTLMTVSLYCSFGVLKSWLDLYHLLGRKQKAIESNETSPAFGPSFFRRKPE